MRVELDPQEVKFIEAYVKNCNLVDAVREAFPGYADAKVSDCYVKGKAVLRRYPVAKKLNELFDETLLSPKLVLRALYEEICDPSEKHPRIAATKLASEILQMRTEKIDLNLQGKTDEELRQMIIGNLMKPIKKEADGEPGDKPGEPRPEPVNKSGR